MIPRPAMFLLAIASLAAGGCKHDDMADQPRAKTYGKSSFFTDAADARPLIAGTVSTDGITNQDEKIPWSTAIPDNAPFPHPLSLDDLHRGKELFTIYCIPCHGATGEGDGMIVYRGFARPPSYHDERLRQFGPGHFYNVITNGWGAMYNFADRIQPGDRWRIAGYIKALQLSQHTPKDSVSEDAVRAGGQHE